MAVVEDILEFGYLLMFEVNESRGFRTQTFLSFHKENYSLGCYLKIHKLTSSWGVKRRQGERNREMTGAEYATIAFWGWEM